MASQQLVILSRENDGRNGLSPIGSRREILDSLACKNTSPQRDGEDILYGPGIRIELPPDEPITQMLMTITEEEIGWQVIMRLARQCQWKLFDPVSGRELSPPDND